MLISYIFSYILILTCSYKLCHVTDKMKDHLQMKKTRSPLNSIYLDNLTFSKNITDKSLYSNSSDKKILPEKQRNYRFIYLC